MTNKSSKTFSSSTSSSLLVFIGLALLITGTSAVKMTATKAPTLNIFGPDENNATQTYEAGEHTPYTITPNETDCVFPVVLNTSSINCDNYVDLLTRAKWEKELIHTAYTLVSGHIKALKESYKFMTWTCENGFFGLDGVEVPQVTGLLELHNQLKSLHQEALKYIELGPLHQRSLELLQVGNLLLQEGPRCTKVDREQRCTDYLNQTTYHINSYTEFFKQLVNAYIWLEQVRIPSLTQWRDANKDKCVCRADTNCGCCKDDSLNIDSLSEYWCNTTCQLVCSCCSNFTEDCCDLPAYSDTEQCQCYDNATFPKCCSYNPWVTDEPLCKECFNTSTPNYTKCCSNDDFYKDNKARCDCETNFNAEACCKMDPYKSTLDVCFCTNHFENNKTCCEDVKDSLGIRIFGVRIECRCEPPYWDEDYCCNQTKYIEQNGTCECKHNYTAKSCCHLEPYHTQEPECSCSKNFTIDKCCGLYPYNNTDNCTCDRNISNPSVKTCCEKRPDKYGEDLHCYCLNNGVTTDNADTCCDYKEFENNTICKCKKNINATHDKNENKNYCCDVISEYSSDIPNTYCHCLNKQNVVIDGSSNCCEFNITKFDNDDSKKLCNCGEQTQTNLHSPLECCTGPYVGLLTPQNSTDCKCDLGGVPNGCCHRPIFEETPYCRCEAQDKETEGRWVNKNNNDCCDFDDAYDKNSTEIAWCNCRNAQTPEAIEACCDIYDLFSTKDICRCKKVTVFDSTCCGVPVSEWQTTSAQHKCDCFNRHTKPELKAIDKNSNPAVDCCDTQFYSETDECTTCKNITDVTQNYVCCNYEPFIGNSTAQKSCECKNNIEPDDFGKDCCDQTRFLSHPKCLCPSVDNISENATTLQCCDKRYINLTTDKDAPVKCGCNASISDDHEICRCLKENPLTNKTCCELGDKVLNARPLCKCIEEQEKYPKNLSQACCNLPELTRTNEADHNCKCEFGNILYNDSLDCCDYVSSSKDNTKANECICQKQDTALGTVNCCQDKKFINNVTAQHLCFCAGNDLYDSERKQNCCDTQNWESRPQCTCPKQEQAILNNDNTCCSYFPFNETAVHNCTCFSAPNPIILKDDGTLDRNCCDTEKHKNSLYCNCSRNFNSTLCCNQGISDFDDLKVCQCMKQSIDSPVDPIDCCDQPKFENTTACKCQKVPFINASNQETIDCCGQPKFKANDTAVHICNCKKGIDTSYQCCDVPNVIDAHKCTCNKQEQPIVDGSDCCEFGTVFPKDPVCTCSKAETYNSTVCCRLEKYKKEDPACYCPGNETLDCCSYNPNSDFCKCNSDNDVSQNFREHTTDCCKYFGDTELCQCKAQMDLNKTARGTYNCCNVYKNESRPECDACYFQHDAIVPAPGKDCCEHESHKNDTICKCLRNFNPVTCCTDDLLPTDPRCKCTPDPQPNITVLKCVFGDTLVKDYDPDATPANKSNHYTDSEIVLKDKVLLHNRLVTGDNHTESVFTTTLVELLGQGEVAELGTSGVTFTLNQLPWNGTLSVNLIAAKSVLAESTTVLSNEQFVVTVQYNSDTKKYTYTVNQNGTEVASLTFKEPSSVNSNWWPSIDDRTNLLANYSLHKLELLWSGVDCWINVIGPNDKSAFSDVWTCLEPARTVDNLIAAEGVSIRKDFGAFELGGTSQDVLYSNLYVLANLHSPGVSRPVVKIETDPTPDPHDQHTCEVSWNLDKVNLLFAEDGKVVDQCRKVATTNFGNVGVIEVNHAPATLPDLYSCPQQVVFELDDLSVKTHLCRLADQEPKDFVKNITLDSVLNILDLLALSTNYEAYNPLVQLNNAEDNAELLLIADKQSGFHTVVVPHINHTALSSLQVSFDLDIVSFPWEILNAINATTTAKLSLGIRAFGETVISVNFYINRTKDTDGFNIVREVAGIGLNNCSTSENMTIDVNSISYAAQIKVTPQERALSVDFSDQVKNGYNFKTSYDDFVSSELEVSIETSVCYGKTYGCFVPNFIPDRSAVLRLSNFQLKLSTTDVQSSPQIKQENNQGLIQ